jgi:hypothetical protein
MEPIVKRAVFIMLTNGDMDERMNEQFFEKDGTLNVEIVTGLQALSRDSDLQKLMQMGDMVRNLPPDALRTFRWDAYSRALISSLGFDPRMWVKTENELAKEQAMMQQQAAQQQAGPWHYGAESPADGRHAAGQRQQQQAASHPRLQGHPW